MRLMWLVVGLGVMVLAASGVAHSTRSLPSSQIQPALDAWVGTWTGTMQLHGSPGQPHQTVDITFSMERLPEAPGYTWVMTYHSEQHPMTKDYRLLPDAADSTRWNLDEQNGIVLPSRLTDGVLYSLFGVGDTLLTSRQELVGDELRFEVTSNVPMAEAAENAAGVVTYRVGAVQSVKMKKKATEN